MREAARRTKEGGAGRKEEFAADSGEFHFYGEWLHYEALYLQRDIIAVERLRNYGRFARFYVARMI